MFDIEYKFNELFLKIDRILDILESGGIVAPKPEPCPYTLHAWLAEWYDTYKVPSCKPNTLAVYDVAIRIHICPKLPDAPLNFITGLELQKFLMSIPTSRTRKTVHDVLNMAFKDAIDLKLLKDNPIQGVKIPVHHRTQGVALTRKEIEAFTQTLKGRPIETYFLLLLYTGMRRNEALALRRSDIDFQNKLLHVPGTKTKSSERTLPLFENVGGLLVGFKRSPPDKKLFDYNEDYVTHKFKSLCPAHKLHDLRHTFATQCLNAKIPMIVVQKWLGHSDIDTTADIYTHVTEEIHTQEAAQLNAFFSRPKG